MSIIQIREAQREGARLVVGIAGVSGSGKTYTALQLAYGLANFNAKKVGFIDTENRRGSLYADALPSPFLIGDLYAPFTPVRYKQAIEEFQAAGVEVLVIDSTSHEYEGEGGYLEIRKPLPGKSANRDNVAAEEHKKFMRALLQSSMHIVACVRAREKVMLERDSDGKTVYVPLGLQPIQHRDFMFEMTASVMMHDMGTRQDVLKCPVELAHILGRGTGYITADDGRALRAWVDGAKQIDPKVEKARGDLLLVTEQGLEKFKAAWMALPKTTRAALGAGFRDQCAASAEAFDIRQAATAGTAPDENPAIGALNSAAAAIASSAPNVVHQPVAQAAPQAAPAQAAQPAAADKDFF